MRLFFAILVGKFIAFVSRTFHIGGGSAAPGLYALKICPGLVEGLSRKIPKNVVITGTNGKTTTARILAHLAKESSLKVIRNSTGSNLERGIASTLALHTRSGKLNYELGIWELDEAAFNSVAPKLKPDIVVFLNVFRDQLDRYGEIDSVVKRWCVTLGDLNKNTLILVNGDDINTNKLSYCFKGNTYRFGIKDFKIVGEGIERRIGNKTLDFEAKDVELNNLDGSFFKTILHSKPYPTSLPLPGLYHIYDFLAAFAVGHELEFKTDRMISSLKKFSPAFGRFEKLPFGYIFLIKNPAGATQVFKTLAPVIKPEDRLLIALNDNLADGTDVSWIWDAQFEELLMHNWTQKSRGAATIPPPRWKLVVSGNRANDLALRLKYASFEPTSLKVEPSLEKALREARIGLKGSLYILPTYTALLELQKILAKQGTKSYYWKEE